MAPKKKTSAIAKLALERVQKVKEEQERIEKEKREEEERIRLELEAYQKEQEEKARLLEEKQRKKLEKKQELKRQGLYLTKREKEKRKKSQEKLRLLLHAHNTISLPSSDAKTFTATAKEYRYRSPIISVLGHVDVGKTSFLDYLQKTRTREAGDITQNMKILYHENEDDAFSFPGLYFIDTPGHDSFGHIRQNSSSYCDLAILMVDIMKGLEKQSLTCMEHFLENNIPFLIVCNKIDRIYEWQSDPNKTMKENYEEQSLTTKQEFDSKISAIQSQVSHFQIYGNLYWKEDKNAFIPLLPISVKTLDGVQELFHYMKQYLVHLVHDSLLIQDNLEAHVLDKESMEGHGNTIPLLLVQGMLSKGMYIFIQTSKEWKKSKIRSILTFQNMHWKSQDKIKGSIHAKLILEEDLEPVVGSRIMLELPLNIPEEEISENKIQCSKDGVFVYTNSLNSLEALHHVFRSDPAFKISIGSYKTGSMSRKDMIYWITNLEHQPEEFRVILCFGVSLSDELFELAQENEIRIIQDDVIYRLYDHYKQYHESIFLRQKEEHKNEMVYPCVLKMLPGQIFNNKNPIIIGVEILHGTLHLHTPLYIPSLPLSLGRVESIENDHVAIDRALKGQHVAIKIQTENPSIQCGRHFHDNHEIVSYLSRSSIDVLKKYYRSEISNEDLHLIVRLKKLLHIP